MKGVGGADWKPHEDLKKRDRKKGIAWIGDGLGGS
jgi:hypothetical protein